MPRRSHDRDRLFLLKAIQQIRAIDNHSYAMPARVPATDEGDRPEPLGTTPFLYPARPRVTDPEHTQA